MGEIIRAEVRGHEKLAAALLAGDAVIRSELRENLKGSGEYFAEQVAAVELSGAVITPGPRARLKRSMVVRMSDKPGAMLVKVYPRSPHGWVLAIGQKHDTKQHVRRAPKSGLRKADLGRMKDRRFRHNGRNLSAAVRMSLKGGLLQKVQSYDRPTMRRSRPFMDPAWGRVGMNVEGRMKSTVANAVAQIMNGRTDAGGDRG